jgi:hypothetical protein
MLFLPSGLECVADRIVRRTFPNVQPTNFSLFGLPVWLRHQGAARKTKPNMLIAEIIATKNMMLRHMLLMIFSFSE